jgi:CCR4-NOT transcription complex subunit 9
MTSLLQEIISVYTLLNPSQLTAAASNRVCNALALLQCVASHNDTRTLFLNGMIRYPSTDSAIPGLMHPLQPIFPSSFTPSSTRRQSRDPSSIFD